jgi:hypothetical protein
MKLIRVESFFDGSKVVFFYSAENRVDFRELVKDLVKALRTRVEMRQIGIRHEAKMLGGMGSCGRELCCSSYLKGFDPISIKMAKAQNLPLNPSKISGLCGRLLCCLTYEYNTYLALKKELPTLGKPCRTPAGEGKVVRQNILKQTITVALPDGGIADFTGEDMKRFREGKYETATPEDRKDREAPPQEEKAQEAHKATAGERPKPTGERRRRRRPSKRKPGDKERTGKAAASGERAAPEEKGKEGTSTRKKRGRRRGRPRGRGKTKGEKPTKPE